MKKIGSVLLCMAFLGLLFCGCKKEETVYVIPRQAPKLTQTQVINKNLNKNKYKEFFEFSEETYLLAALEEDFIPQGTAIIDGYSLNAVSYYHNSVKKYPSVIVFTNNKTGEIYKAFYVKNEDGTYNYSHLGGIAYDGFNLWVTGDDEIYRMPIKQIISSNADYITLSNRVNVEVNPSYINYSRGWLFVGEFHNYSAKVSTSHKYAGNKAWCLCYNLNINKNTDYDTLFSFTKNQYAVPNCVLSVPDKVQGFTLTGKDRLVLSTSYGRKNESALLIYENVLNDEISDTVAFGNAEVPIYALTKNNSVVSVTLPPMAEGIDSYADDSVMMVFESGAKKYRGNGKDPIDTAVLFNVENCINLNKQK